MSTDTMLNKLNRLRLNAGKPELKSWKASKDKLMDAISSFENQGFQDVFPGANTDAAPVTTDPEIIKALAKANEEKDEDPPKGQPKITKIKSELARGVPGAVTPHTRGNPLPISAKKNGRRRRLLTS
jgi:hypothetical protein